MALITWRKWKTTINELESPELLEYSGRKEQEILKKEHISMDIACKIIKTNSQIASEQRPIGHFIYQRNNHKADEKSTSIFKRFDGSCPL